MPEFRGGQISPLITSVDSNVLKINASSLVFDNTWISFSGYSFNIQRYVSDAINDNRTRFFQNRDYAVFLLIGLDKLGNISVLEGTQVKYTGVVDYVPAPARFNIAPLAGLVLIQDGSSDLNSFKEVSNKNVIVFSGSGNIVDKNRLGDVGFPNPEIGPTGMYGETGLRGYAGITGLTGDPGYPGVSLPGETGAPGVQGVTGISWNIHFPLIHFN